MVPQEFLHDFDQLLDENWVLGLITHSQESIQVLGLCILFLDFQIYEGLVELIIREELYLRFFIFGV